MGSLDGFTLFFLLAMTAAWVFFAMVAMRQQLEIRELKARLGEKD